MRLRRRQTDTTAALRRDAEPARPSSNELLAVAEHHWPNPAAHPHPAGRQGWGVGPPAWTDRPHRQAVGLVQQERRP
jgi:hypothetical protein